MEQAWKIILFVIGISAIWLTMDLSIKFIVREHIKKQVKSEEQIMAEESIKRLALLEELFRKLDFILEIDCEDYDGCNVFYVVGKNSKFDDGIVTDDETVELISKLKGNEIEHMYDYLDGLPYLSAEQEKAHTDAEGKHHD